MKELGYIQNEEEYNEAVKQAEEGLKFSKKLLLQQELLILIIQMQ